MTVKVIRQVIVSTVALTAVLTAMTVLVVAHAVHVRDARSSPSPDPSVSAPVVYHKAQLLPDYQTVTIGPGNSTTAGNQP
jgi:hypothetical protein